MDTLHTARKYVKGKRVRVWYYKIAHRSWKAIVIDPVTKIRIKEGPTKTTARGSVNALRIRMEKELQKKKTSTN